MADGPLPRAGWSRTLPGSTRTPESSRKRARSGCKELQGASGPIPSQHAQRREHGGRRLHPLRSARDAHASVRRRAHERVRGGGAPRRYDSARQPPPARLLRASVGDLAGGAYELEALLLVLKLRTVRFHSVGLLLRLGLRLRLRHSAHHRRSSVGEAVVLFTVLFFSSLTSRSLKTFSALVRALPQSRSDLYHTNRYRK